MEKGRDRLFIDWAWKAQDIDRSRIGIDNMRMILQDLLDSHIKRELPRVREDVRRLLNATNDVLIDSGVERSSPNQIRVYLTRISSDFHNVVKAGVVQGGICRS